MTRLIRPLVLLSCLAIAYAADAQAETSTQVDVSAERLAEGPIGGFVPKKLPAIIALALFGFSGIIHWINFFVVGKRPFLLSLTLGMTAMALGFVLRMVFAKSPYSQGLYIIMEMLILLSPCAFLATDYMLLARLSSTFDVEVQDECLLVRASRIVNFFVWSDCLTFFLQASGGGLQATKNSSTANIGNKIVMVGLVLQLVSFAFFTVVLMTFGWRMRNLFPTTWRSKHVQPLKLFSRQPIADWRILYFTILTTCIGILTRSAFRIAEFAGGYNGFIATHEGYFYLLDSLPLWVAMSLYCIVWPTRALHPHPTSSATELKMTRNVV
ncbi:RTA1 like protein-domain-containing protein [Mycena sp. CBHHK59/15]|nr:RTA1 like protein-domain-containing protein [Mycena sp. CBHHK59/15]